MTTIHKGKEIAKPITPPSETASEEDSDPEQAQRDKDMQNNLALIAKYFKKIYKPTNNNLRTSSNSKNKNMDTTLQFKNDNQLGKFRNQRKVNVVAARENVGSQYDWLKDTNEEVDEQELEAHYSYMGKIHDVPTVDLGTDAEPVEQVQNDAGYNVFANVLQHSEQSESNDQNDVESDDERVALSNLIANIKFDVDENIKIQKHLKKANTTLAQELKECKTILAKTSKSLRESISVRDSYLVALQTKLAGFEKYKALKDRTIDYNKLERKLNEALGQLAQKDTVIREGLKTKAYELSVVKEKHDELMKQSLLTKSHYESLVKQKNEDALAELQCMYLHKVKECDCLKSNHLRDKVLPNNSQVKVKKTQVEVHPRIPSVSNKMKSITACKDSLNSRTLNANAICATCNKCLVDSNHFACVTKMLNDIHARTKKHTIVQLILLIVDSGCTKHMTDNLRLLCNFDEKFMGTVRFGNDQFVPILGYGDLVKGNVMINRVYYVASLNYNIFSVGQFWDADLEVAFKKSTCFVRDLQGNDLLVGNRGSDLYTISLQESTSLTSICLMAKATPTQAWLWHRRLSHLNFDYINLLLKKDIMIGLPKLKYVKDQLCLFCKLSKAKRSSFKSKVVPSFKGMLNLLHMEHLCGPMRVARINGKKYILVIVDDYLRYTWTLFLCSKDETLEVLKDFLIMIQRNLQASVITVRSDPSTNVQSTSASSPHTNVHAEENNNDQAEEGEQIQDDEFTNPLCAPAQEEVESSSHNIVNSNVPNFNQQDVSKYRWTKDHPLEL
nr:retrovirus-related Pol polyprotein from transposon TNT 1-94 [Tanacetum cinerariifolium]